MANFSTSCRTFEGIAAIKRSLHAGIQASKEKGYEVNIFIIGAPKYICEVSSVTAESGREALMVALNRVETEIKAAKGDFSMDKQVEIVIYSLTWWETPTH